MLRTIFKTLGLAAVTLGDLAAMELDRLLRPASESRDVTRRWMLRYGRHALRVLGGEVSTPLAYGESLRGTDASGLGRLFVVNHRSMLDVYVYLAYVEAFALSRADLAHWPFIGIAARRVGTVFVDRSDRSSGSAAVAAMAGALRAGKGILVYPEGTTYEGDEVRPFRAGAFVAAARAGAEVVPLGLAYADPNACYTDHVFIDHWKKMGAMKRVRVALEPGAPLPPESDPERLKQSAHAAVQALVHKARARLSA